MLISNVVRERSSVPMPTCWIASLGLTLNTNQPTAVHGQMSGVASSFSGLCGYERGCSSREARCNGIQAGGRQDTCSA